MELSKVVVEFSTEKSGHPSVTLRTLDGKIRAVSYAVPSQKEGAMPDVHLRVEPEVAADDGNPAMQTVVAQTYLLLSLIASYLICEKHRTVTRVQIALAQRRLEASKAISPYLTENTLEAEVVSVSTGLPKIMVLSLGLAKEYLQNTPNEFEQSIIAEATTDPTASKKRYEEAINAHQFDYEIVVPPLTDAERRLYDEYDPENEPASCHIH